MIFIKKLVLLIVAMFCILSNRQLYAASYQMHTVKSGETYYEIAKNYDTNTNVLQSMNYQPSSNLKVNDLIMIKQIKDITVKVNGQLIEFDTPPYIENGSVFVPIRFVSEALNCKDIDWDQATKTATINADAKTIVITVGSVIAKVNGQAVQLSAPVQFFGERTFVPVRFFSEVLGVTNIAWDENTYTASIQNGNIPAFAQLTEQAIEETTQENSVVNYSEEDLYWLSRIVQVEAGWESFEGKVAVANTIINRKNSPSFPNTIKGVIFDTKYGVQYPPTQNGLINNIPSQESIDASIKALEGYNNVGYSMYFVSSKTSANSWVKNNRAYFMTIGNHEFYL